MKPRNSEKKRLHLPSVLKLFLRSGCGPLLAISLMRSASILSAMDTSSCTVCSQFTLPRRATRKRSEPCSCWSSLRANFERGAAVRDSDTLHASGCSRRYCRATRLLLASLRGDKQPLARTEAVACTPQEGHPLSGTTDEIYFLHLSASPRGPHLCPRTEVSFTRPLWESFLYPPMVPLPVMADPPAGAQVVRFPRQPAFDIISNTGWGI